MTDFHARPDNRTELNQAMPGGFLPFVKIPEDLPQGPIAIADMANAFGVTHRTLHFYEEKNLIRAGRIGLMRVYSQSDAHRLAIITLCREVGMPIAVIQELLEELAGTTSQQECEAIFMNALMIRKRELIAGLSTVHRQMQQITRLIDLQNDPDNSAENDNLPEKGAFSETEHLCLEMMAEGLTPARLASRIAITPEQAATLEAGIIQKFNAHNRFQAVAKAVLLGILK